MVMIFELTKALPGKGSRLVPCFIKMVQKQFRKRLVKYAEHRLADGALKHGFCYGEQSTKTFLTSALDAVCDSDLLQEWAIDRRKPTKKTLFDVGSGKLDYWCRYADKVSLLLEVKQSWIRYDSHDGKPHFYADIKDRHQKAKEQLRNIRDKTLYTSDTLYGLALTIAPIFIRYKGNGETSVRLSKDDIQLIAKKACSKIKADAFGAFTLPKTVDLIIPCDSDEDENQIYESYPGVVLVWSVVKYTKG